MALAANALIADLANLKIYLGITDATQDTLLEILVGALSTKFDQEVGCQIVTKTYTAVKVDGSGAALLYMPGWPVTTLTTVKEDGITLTSGTDFISRPEKGVLERITSVSIYESSYYRWSTKDPLNVELTFVAGYTAANVPADIVFALFKQTAREWQEQKTKSWAEVSRTFPDGSVTRLEQKDLLPEVKAILARYGRKRI